MPLLPLLLGVVLIEGPVHSPSLIVLYLTKLFSRILSAHRRTVMEQPDICTCNSQNLNHGDSHGQWTQESLSPKLSLLSLGHSGGSTMTSPQKILRVSHSSVGKGTWNTYNESWTKFVYKPKTKCSVGMKKKPLVPYDQNHDRSRLPVMLKVQKCRSRDKRTFDNFSLIKNRTILKSTFETMYQKTFKHPEVLRKQKLRESMIE